MDEYQLLFVSLKSNSYDCSIDTLSFVSTIDTNVLNLISRSEEIIMATKTKVLGYTYYIYLCQYGEVWVRYGQPIPQGLQYTGRKVLNPTDLGPVHENFVLCSTQG